MLEQVRTRCATITRTSPHEVEIIFSAAGTLDKSGIAEVIQERKRLCPSDPIGLLLIVPADVELDVAIINTDHQRANQATDNVLALAVVAGNAISETLLRLYKAYYPPTFRAEVFTDEEKARTWLRERVAAALEEAALKGK